MPPLREIREEIPLLANHFLKEYCRETDALRDGVLAGGDAQAVGAAWPGNVRQLRNEVMRLAACARQNLIRKTICGKGFRTPAPRAARGSAPSASRNP